MLIALSLFISQSGLIVWQSMRTVCYHYLRNLREEQMLTLQISKYAEEDVVWVKKDEIRYYGKMFDIKQRQETDSSLMLTGHFDSKEDKLFKWLRRLFEDHSHGKKGKNKTVFWTFDATLLIEDVPLFALEPVSAKSVSARTNCLFPVAPEIPSPPPKFSKG